MSSSILLDQIREQILDSYSLELTNRDESPWLSIELVSEFLEHLRRAINDKEPSQMDTLLDEWLSFNNYGQKRSFAFEVNSLFISIYRCSQLELPIEQSNQLIAELLPIFTHTNQYIYQNEFTQILNQMNQEQASLEKLDKSKSDFISIAAHELKTPLTLLEGYTSMLR